MSELLSTLYDAIYINVIFRRSVIFYANYLFIFQLHIADLYGIVVIRIAQYFSG